MARKRIAASPSSLSTDYQPPTINIFMEKGTSLWKDAWHRLAHNRAAIVSLFVLIVILLLCFIGPLMPFVKSPTVINLANASAAPSAAHWFGTDLLGAQENAWNQGDLDAFMEHYWKSDDLTFSSEGKTTRGWTATLTRYRERYPTREMMGRLKLSGLEITPLGDSAALVLGMWKVQREGGPLSGNFSLVVRKFDERWLIVHDHTSRTKD